MEYCLLNKAQNDKESLNKVISQMLLSYSRELCNYSKSEFDSIVEYDVLNILAFYYAKMDAEQKELIENEIYKIFNLKDADYFLDNIYSDFEDGIYVPYSCKLIDKLGDSRMTSIIYESIFSCCAKVITDNWNISRGYSNYLYLLNAAFFDALAYKLHMRESYRDCLKEYYKYNTFDYLVESLYEDNLDNLGWDSEIEMDLLEQMISKGKKSVSFIQVSEDEFSYALSEMEDIRIEYYSLFEEDEENESKGFDNIVKRTGIKLRKSENIHGFECKFCDAKNGIDEYIVVYQQESRISQMIDKEDEWSLFQHDLYYADINEGHNPGMVYIVYILDDDSSNIPIQVIESNKTYGRKYVFTEEETITFINGIVKTTSDEIGEVSPVQEWDRILREEHLTGCMTDAYSSKKVESYLLGERFDAAYVFDDDYTSLIRSTIPKVKWVKSLDTTGFRDFCFDDQSMEFGQINLFYGANGSGKTSVLEAIEYALTSEVRRVKDFKVKMPTTMYPKLRVFDHEAGVHTFYPELSKKNAKEIERVWYGVPVGRTKTNLNENFNRFNSFDSEAAYKFIHESDNSEENYASMFGNLMFGESVVDHEKKWQRFKKAFNDRYSELRNELNEAKSMAEFYEQMLAQHNDISKADEVEKIIKELVYLHMSRLPKATSERYKKLMEDLTLIRKYVDILSSNDEDDTFADIMSEIAEVKRKNQQLFAEKKSKNDEITMLTEKTGQIKQSIFDEKEALEDMEEELEQINRDIRNWGIVQDVLKNTDTIQLVEDLLDELTKLERELFYISKLEQRPSIISFLKMDDYSELNEEERDSKESQLSSFKNKKLDLENRYAEEKKKFSEKEQQAIELRKIGKTLLVDAKCPLCGHEFDSTQQLVEIIDSSVIVDDGIENLILSIQEITKEIMELESVLDREKLIKKAKQELTLLVGDIPALAEMKSDYRSIFQYYISKADKEKRREEIIEQQSVLEQQGFSLKNIKTCQEYKNTDSTYLEYEEIGNGTYDEFLKKRMVSAQERKDKIQIEISHLKKQIQQNTQREDLLRNDIRRVDNILGGLDVERNREYEQAIENIKTKFRIDENVKYRMWVTKYHELFDKCELEVERIEAESNVAFEKRCLADYKATVKRNEPMVARCAKAVQAFERMPSLSSFVERGIKSNIQQISKFFKWMHHSGEFEELGIDDEGIFAVRGLNHETIRTYQMSTGQRSTIAMAVMFALHIAAPDAPQLLLLDEPLATMDDTQVLNVLDILKSMAEQNTQIFFTTANGIMINLFKECFKNTDFDYKEYEFIKKVNRPSDIREHSINDVKTIEELTLDDLTLDFNQFAQIREILRKNQEKLVPKEEWEIVKTEGRTQARVEETKKKDLFIDTLSEDENNVLRILQVAAKNNQSPISKLVKMQGHKSIIEKINEKAVDFFGETIIDNDSIIPELELDYIDELGI